MALRTEEDVRTKLVTHWLADHGFRPEDFSVEVVFDLHFGRQTKHFDSREPDYPERYRPRADLLVRLSDGRNLMIVETKAPDEPLDDRARVQAISYARLVQNGGGMPPFAVVTNGKKAVIYDVITERPLDQSHIPAEHPYAQRGFRLSVADLELRAEALERLITLDPDNLLTFCKAQVDYRMRLLRAEDPRDGKKYVPGLYVRRPQAEAELSLQIQSGHPVILLIGPPQQGKTNLMCHVAEARLAAGDPTLFFPAVAIGGLLEELREDFEWNFHHGIDTSRVAADRLSRIARSSGRRLVVFVDGWNEASTDAARAIDREGERLVDRGVTLVLSMTTVAARRLMLDGTGNVSALARAAGIPAVGIPAIEVGADSAPKNWHVVTLGGFDEEEARKALEVAAGVYGVRIPAGYAPVRDPLVLRLAMETYAGGVLPPSLDETDLIQKRLLTKLDRARIRDLDAGRVLLRHTAEAVLDQGGPVGYHELLKRLNVPVTEGLAEGPFESALLMRRSGTMGGVSDVDFYYSRERDFVVAHWLRDWPTRLVGQAHEICAAMAGVLESEVESDALRWYLTRDCNLNRLRAALDGLAGCAEVALRRFLLSCLWEVAWNGAERKGWFDANYDWVRGVVVAAAADDDPISKASAAKLMAILADDADDVEALLIDDPAFIRELLMIDETNPLDDGAVGGIVLRALKRVSDEYVTDGKEDTIVSGVLCELTRDPSPVVRAAATTAYGAISPWPFLNWLRTERIMYAPDADPSVWDRYERGLTLAVADIQEGFFGGMCRGEWDMLEGDKDACRLAFDEYAPIFAPIIRAFHGTEPAKTLRHILELLAASTPAGSAAADDTTGISVCACQTEFSLWLPCPLEPVPVPCEHCGV
ncbi:MAG: hypothetical protein AVDCRST_MAG68-3396 [uncultured Gemmatimonadetes bacterium]|uniref:Type I restriction enzyme R protein N-terminal domain-containing protein n=1 Tax=uncultured Gemmatimonadota bacterium TaxID=203437 RepID=A0A6J4LM84_9BACT|nr:MAG: hypothetical protein AVDCRST_MAG68-3396 [uncultured Gemmatimonadota bacterium]